VASGEIEATLAVSIKAAFIFSKQGITTIKSVAYTRAKIWIRGKEVGGASVLDEALGSRELI
jgi:hypothetical protein